MQRAIQPAPLASLQGQDGVDILSFTLIEEALPLRDGGGRRRTTAAARACTRAVGAGAGRAPRRGGGRMSAAPSFGRAARLLEAFHLHEVAQVPRHVGELAEPLAEEGERVVQIGAHRDVAHCAGRDGGDGQWGVGSTLLAMRMNTDGIGNGRNVMTQSCTPMREKGRTGMSASEILQK